MLSLAKFKLTHKTVGIEMITNEETRCPVYFSQQHQPTIPSKVSPNTPLQELNLNWKESDLPERERTKHVHRLHPYFGKFIPQLVEVFLRKYFVKGQTVLDPFCGSGTTLVQANELGINSIGYDISAFNVLLSKAKTSSYDVKKMEEEVKDILYKVQIETQATSVQTNLEGDRLTKLGLSNTDDEYLKTWFAPRALNELLTYRYFIETENYIYKDLLKVILTRSARSARLTTHFNLDFPVKPQKEPYYCHKHSRQCYPTIEAYKFIRRYSFDTIKRIKEFDKLRTEAQVSVYDEDSRISNIPNIDGVITSPPYVGLIDYHEQHAYAYHLLGLKDKKELEIGAAAKGTSKRSQEAYQEDMALVLANVAKSMASEGFYEDNGKIILKKID